MGFIPPATESAPPMGLVTPPDRQARTLDEVLKEALQIIDRDGELDDMEVRSLMAFGQSMQLMQERRMQRMQGAQQGPPQPQGGAEAGPQGQTEPYGTKPGTQQKPLGLTGGF